MLRSFRLGIIEPIGFTISSSLRGQFKSASSSGGPAPNAMMQKDGIGSGIMSGFNQAQAHAQFVANAVDFYINVQVLGSALFRKGNSGCTVNIEDGYPKEVCEQLAVQGHHVNIVPQYPLVTGRDNVTMHDDKLGAYFGASDPRADGHAITEMSLC
jgi:gamma-glutamyltranspeptidase/glutathione hydrolase